MNPISIQVKNPLSVDVYQQAISVGVPIPQGAVVSVQALTLSLDAGFDPVYQLNVLSRWPDDSLRWVLVQCLATLKSMSVATIRLQQTEKNALDDPDNARGLNGAGANDQTVDNHVQMHRQSACLTHQESTTELKVDTGLAQFVFSKQGDILPRVSMADRPVLGHDRWRLVFRDDSGQEVDIDVTEPPVVENVGAHRIGIVITGCYRSAASDKTLYARFRFNLFANSAMLCLDVSLHNPSAATHPGGFWDLGDDASMLFREFSLVVSRGANSTAMLRTTLGEPFHQADGQRECLTQWSSGGVNWNSDNHVDAAGSNTTPKPGYQLRQGSSQRDGYRASPTVRLMDEPCNLLLGLAKFWQNFPKSLEILPDKITLGLFPHLPDTCHELQGGERKTHSLHADFSGHAAALEWIHAPMQVTVPGTAFCASGVFAFTMSKESDDTYDRLVNIGLDSDKGFLAKREVGDEYGWRHFGDLYADHESWNYPGHDLLISHYNNQYDPIYGLARQYCLSEDTRWFTLCQELARHVMDIDIYRTTEDREEYNNGLFWHTNHYVQAFTATHRTFSKHHVHTETDRRSGGGGPGSEHCYTTGLVYYYFLTGDTEARDSVLLLTDWITRVHEGSGTVLELILGAVKRDLPDLWRLIKGEFRFRYRYPLNRGTGNYLNALLDSYELDADIQLLARAEAVISESIGPADEIRFRYLDDVEANWSYTVYLQALIKYLCIKVIRCEFDSAFVYSRNALLHYAQWMVENEQPYLDWPDKLEFVNDTWAAQDIRKACILIAAHRFRRNDSVDFLSRASEFREHVVNCLTVSEQTAYTRILVILMQSHGPTAELFDEQVSEISHFEEPIMDEACVLENYQLTKRKIVMRLLRAFVSSLRHLSLRKEMSWLRHRVG